MSSLLIYCQIQDKENPIGLRDEGQGLRGAPGWHESQAWFPGANKHKAQVSTRAKVSTTAKPETSRGAVAEAHAACWDSPVISGP